ncbi:FAD-dependent oxidoreductase [Caballeronia sp. LZ062]|uniref:FAD-dependent oxidoreductase n=1 Tax=unclassified Caballeronia TaxID=2646786 RepID=UPI0028642E58|nr:MULTISPECIES: FAD-dependent oxidoreductase [unclassified Caballeronia]MDR5856648.1 FAD-dependent oxidoreductase [Caballeronia sp. LZ050]MDR5868766.1 FAD-dependent oxidoreductase [Caballeronia sp. LZ062]
MLKTEVSDYLSASRLADGIYVVGTLQSGVTVYSQQVRALNLVYSLLESQILSPSVTRVAVIGGGIAGLTLAAAVAVMGKHAHVSVLEQHADLCPLQQGSDTRWLHPHIYDWPAFGSRQPSAMLPFLQWREGRASDVASEILKRFAEVCDSGLGANKAGDRIAVYLDVKEMKIVQQTREISWVGSATAAADGFFKKTEGIGRASQFDLILLAVGFGRERAATVGIPRLYWQNDDLSQPRLSEESRTFLISGSGDGALVDLFRLTIERFRQDRIVYELFGANLEMFEALLRSSLQSRTGSWWRLFEELELSGESFINDAILALRHRIRKDTRVILHVAGSRGQVRSLEGAIEQKSAILNKLLTFLLHRCGAFIPSFRSMPETIERFRPDQRDIICRHGTDPKATIRDLFFNSLLSVELRAVGARTQDAKPLWPRGYFPIIPGATL